MVGLKGYLSPCTDCIYFCLISLFKAKILVDFCKFPLLFYLYIIIRWVFFFYNWKYLLVDQGYSMPGLSKSVCWCNLLAMFANKNSCCTMQPLEYLRSLWVVHMSRCRIPTGRDGYSDRNNGNETLCFTGSHFRCYVWLDLHIQWVLSLSVAANRHKTRNSFCVAVRGKATASAAFTMECKPMFY